MSRFDPKSVSDLKGRVSHFSFVRTDAVLNFKLNSGRCSLKSQDASVMKRQINSNILYPCKCCTHYTQRNDICWYYAAPPQRYYKRLFCRLKNFRAEHFEAQWHRQCLSQNKAA